MKWSNKVKKEKYITKIEDFSFLWLSGVGWNKTEPLIIEIDRYPSKQEFKKKCCNAHGKCYARLWAEA